jgi:hypothetical protein
MSIPNPGQRRTGTRRDHWPLPSIYAIDTPAAWQVRTHRQEIAAKTSTSRRLPSHPRSSISLYYHFAWLYGATGAVTLADGDQSPKSVEQGDLSMRHGIEREGCRIECPTLSNRPGLVFV